jgi:SAM-dependent methyltransferase
VKRLSKRDLDEHNLSQIRYFERSVKPTMVPANSHYLRRHVDEVLRFASISPDERVLEVGCGMGRYTLILAQRGVRVEGLDLSPRLLDRLRAFDGGRYNIPLYCADVLRHPPELAGRFDAVVGFFTLHHLHDLPQCFEAMARLLKPGGRMVFLEPNPYNLLYYIQILVTPRMTWQGDKGIVQMRPALIFRAMQSAGLGRLAMTRFGFFPPFLANRRWGPRLEAALERVPIWYTLLPFQMFRAEQP